MTLPHDFGYVIAALAIALAVPPLTAPADEPVSAQPAAEPAPAAIPLDGMVPTGSALPGRLAQTVRANPGVLAAHRRCEAAGLDVDAVRLSFRTPSLKASAGIAESPYEVPSGFYSPSVPLDAASVQAGVEAPIAAGVYGGAGVRQRSLRVDGETDGDAVTSAGGHLRIPLLRDRGFAVNRLELDSLSQTERAAAHRYEAEVYDAWTSVVDAYAQVLFRIADAREVSNALARAEQLVDDSAARAELEDLAEYQVFPARFEAATRAEELAEARTQILVARETLKQAIGAEPEDAESPSSVSSEDAYALLSAWAGTLQALDFADAIAAVPEKTCPEVLAAEAEWLAARSRATSAHEDLKSSLDLNLGAGWNSEEDGTSGHEAGYGVSIVYSRPLSHDGDRAAVHASEARAAAAGHDYAAEVLRAQVRREKALAALEGIRGRYQLARTTVEAARRSLDAENERFAIGDGSSRNVLDAQKDLTTARRRELSVYLEVITTVAEFLRASGIPPFTPTQDSP